MLDDAHDIRHQHKKLRIFSSPLVHRADKRGDGVSRARTWETNLDGSIESDDEQHGHEEELPRFERYEEPTLLEIFYDLFFAANYNVFSDTQQVTGRSKFKASVGYFCLLWLTWFQVAMFDVRYVTDSIFSRITRAIQLGVLVGFVVVAPKFHPNNQDPGTMRAMSLILCVSRACLAIEYASTLWHVRRYKKARMPLYMQIAIHAAASAVYLGVTFRFTDGKQSRVYLTWYFIAGAEAIASVLISNVSSVASLTDTHMMKRMALLTVMILGEGIQQLAKEVVTIVKNPDVWDSLTVSLVTAAATTIYLVFLVYFDWLRSSFHLPRIRQQLWTCLHLPFHLSLVLFMQAFTQYLLWSKIVSQINRIGDISDPTDDARNPTSIDVRNSLNASVHKFFNDYPPKISSTMETVNEALNNITRIPDKIWPMIANPSPVTDDKLSAELDAAWDTLGSVVYALYLSMANALYGAFGINLDDDVSKKDPAAAKNIKDGGYQLLVQDKTWRRYKLVFAYGYITAGSTILLMIMLTIIARTTPFKVWPIVRLIIIFLLAIGTGLVATLWYNAGRLDTFLSSAWVMPIITLVWVVIAILTHINGQGIKRNKERFRRRQTGKMSHHERGVALTSRLRWRKKQRGGDDRNSQTYL
ncbi:low temperature requirement A [Pochonia chlamydosporia 170]|uniref:Low temperature requirement A n=1 Tax=Pochonia chlamydosporia 170 TaxID=1380566 RepID=A0A179F020_METCM|nr:low temperature requirement A [Pochonia chlamydosporia 170]OAQ58443.1 low temperature requirement A [Pochonia chlamydosporia 170]